MGLQEDQEARMPGPTAWKVQALTQVGVYAEDSGRDRVLCRILHLELWPWGLFLRGGFRQHCDQL